MDSMSEMSSENNKLTDAQKARIERNRQHAILLRQSRLANHPYLNKESNVSRVSGTKMLDTGAGFLLEECEIQKKNDKLTVIYPESPLIPPQRHVCVECQKQFEESFLWNNFDLLVCNDCRDEADKHSFMTKTDAKSEFLLKDVDLEKREPLLRFILRKNPHNQRWGDMKLFLRSQVYERAIEVWGSEEEIEEARTKRDENREKTKQKKFNKEIKQLRMKVRSSSYTKDIGGHEHSYGPETYDEERDLYSKICETCGQSINYEKM